MRGGRIKLKYIACAVLATTSVLLLTIFSIHAKRVATLNLQAGGLVEQLWSADEKERESAKALLVKLGEKSVPPLIMLLTELERDPTPRYAPGREEEAKQAETDYRSLVESGRREEARDALHHLMNLKVNWRLKQDVCELLGRLKAEEATGILIESMEDWPSSESWENMNPAMSALVEIGSAAVPKIIEALETARRRAAATPFADRQPSDFFVKAETAKYQARSAMVLGDIGDARALSVLESLETSTDSQWLLPYFRRAILKIRENNKH